MSFILRIGEFNSLNILSKEPHGYHLDGGDAGIVFLGHRLLEQKIDEDQPVRAFVYKDNKQRLVATLQEPLAQVGKVSYLKVLDVNKIGAFLDFGLPKDLLAPFHEQVMPMEQDRSYLVMVFLDGEKRIAASAKLDEFLMDENEGTFEEGQEVDIIIADKTELGVKAVVNDTHWGVLYNNEIFQRLSKGQRHKAYIKKIREDGRIDLNLQKAGFSQGRLDDLSNKILTKIDHQGGLLAMNDKSSPAEISAVFGVSKKQFKQAVGKLYKLRLITFENDGIKKVEASS
ncbi:MAG: GntR family transcriptional regulator [Pseudomonadales bacterium]|nr:GntR family transcriptional regulator [Pseudomonadales bacterium]